MKPNFALTLSFDGIGLLHRAPKGWHLVGEVALSQDDLAGALAMLRRTAVQLDSAGLRSKLVIPNEQIRYLSLPAPMRDVDRAAHVAEALDGATPYAVADLCYDWVAVGSVLHVAAVARETLDEAEAFAEDHDFAPVSFVAIPAEDQFPGEPFFGLTRAAGRLIDPADRLMRDTHAMRIIGRTDAAIPPFDDASPAASASLADTGAADARDTVADTDAPPATSDAAPAPDEPMTFASRRAQSVAAAQVSPSPDTPSPDTPSPDTPPPVTPSPGVTAPETIAPDTIAPDATPEHGSPDAPAVATASAKAEEPTPPETDKPRRPVVAELPPLPSAAPRVKRPDQAGNGKAAKPVAPKAPPPKPKDMAAASTPQPTAFRSPPPPLPDAAGGGLGAVIARLRAKPSAEPDATMPPASTGASVSPGTSEAEKQRLTIFGARDADADPAGQDGRPRSLGLILTGVLLAALAGAAAWSSIGGDSGLRGFLAPADDTVIAAVPPAEEPATPIIDASPVIADDPDTALDLTRLDDSDLLADQPSIDTTVEDIAPDPRPGDVDTALSVPTVDLDMLPETATDTPDPQQPDTTAQMPPADPVDTALSSYAATGIWLTAPAQPRTPPSGTLDDLYLASIDTSLQNYDAVALPEARALTDDARPVTQSSPAAPGTTFDLDDRGLVTATPDGAETPEGVIVFAGRPAVTPEGMPTRFEATPQPDAQLQPDPFNLRPRLRPETLAESNERAQLGGLSRDELAGLRPRARPDTLAAVALALRDANETGAVEDTTPDDAAEADAIEDTTIDATAQAIATSLKPLARPRNFASTVESTREAQQPRQQQQQQQPQQQVASAATLAPQRNAAPQIPSSASVAQQATVRGAINLRQVNLIGVYGQPSNRRALVRLSNGRYQKVQVGDRLDGGQVRAIGDSELSYVKGNRSFVLTIPQG